VLPFTDTPLLQAFLHWIHRNTTCCDTHKPRVKRTARDPTQEITMLHYAVVFFVVALIAAVFGFGGIAAGAVGIAKVLFVVFLIMAIVSFIMGRKR
jgi:uncharacterized membrane protein YtjA (UPF0391 family)